MLYFISNSDVNQFHAFSLSTNNLNYFDIDELSDSEDGLDDYADIFTLDNPIDDATDYVDINDLIDSIGTDDSTDSTNTKIVSSAPNTLINASSKKFVNFRDFLPPQIRSSAELNRLRTANAVFIDKDNRLQIDLTTMANYLSERLSIYRYGYDLYLYNQVTGIYERKSELDVESILKKYCDFVDKSLWQCHYQSPLYKALSVSVKLAENILPNAKYLTFLNGTLCLDNMEFTKHSPEYNATNRLPHDYFPSAACPVFDATLVTIFANDTDTINCFWEMFGYFLYYGTDLPLQKFFIFLGEGSNGKSLLLKIIRYAIGSHNCSSARLEEITSSDFGASMFFGHMLNISPETEPQKAIPTGLLKAVTGGDDITINGKNKKPFSAPVYTKFLFATNNVFAINDTSYGIFRRMQVFPFTQTFHELPANGEREEGILYADKNLFSQIQPEICGIINRALAGLSRLKNNGWEMTISAACEDTLKLFQCSTPDTLIHEFCQQHLRYDPTKRINQTVICTTFENFLDRAGIENSIKQSLTAKSNRKKLYASIEQELQSLYPNADIHCGKSNGYQVFYNVACQG